MKYPSIKISGTTSISQLWLKVRGAYPWVQIAVAKSLVRLKQVAEKEYKRNIFDA